MVETRVDAETGDWNVVAPGRAGRPIDRVSTPAPCPFCWGNEAMTPPEVHRVPAGAREWQIRVVPNKYPATSNRDEKPPTPNALPFTGRHEVVIESGQHDWDLRSAGTEEVMAVLVAVRERCRVLAADRPAVVSAFRNYGALAGASLAHPHSQIVALDLAPPPLSSRWQRAREYRELTGTCLHDAIAEAERDDGARTVVDTGDVLVFQPWAAAMPHQTTLMTGDRSPDLANASDGALAALARVLPRVLAGLATVLDDPAYNLVVHSGPADDPTAQDWYRWHVTIYPRVTMVGGLELETGLAVNPTMPEQTAPILRDALG
jgi:UDPglucose--hexose-1-phosphate uridylyltransferase